MLAAIVLRLQPVGESALPVSHGAFAHAAALDLFVRLKPALAEALHAPALARPFTTGPVVGDFAREDGVLRVAPGAGCDWRLTGLTREVSEELVRLTPSVGGIRIGPSVFAVEGVAAAPDAHSDAGSDTYKDLYRRCMEDDGPEAVTFDFLTPTTFRSGGREQPFPLPRQVLGHLVEKWNAWSGLPLGELRDVLGDAILLSAWHGGTRRVELGGRRTVGFVGSFTYRPAAPEAALRRLLGLLGRFAFYAGVGWQTAHGMGQVRVREFRREPRGGEGDAGA